MARHEILAYKQNFQTHYRRIFHLDKTIGIFYIGITITRKRVKSSRAK